MQMEKDDKAKKRQGSRDDTTVENKFSKSESEFKPDLNDFNSLN